MFLLSLPIHRIDLTEKTVTQAEIDEVEKEEEENWDFQEEWWSSYQEVMQGWTNVSATFRSLTSMVR